MASPGKESALELLKRKLAKVDEHRQDLRVRLLPEAWQKFYQSLPTAKPPSSLPSLDEQRRIKIRRDEDKALPVGPEEHDRRLAAKKAERELQRVAEDRRKNYQRTLIAPLVQQLVALVAQAPVAIRPELQSLIESDSSFRDATKHIVELLVERPLPEFPYPFPDEAPAPALIPTDRDPRRYTSTWLAELANSFEQSAANLLDVLELDLSVKLAALQLQKKSARATSKQVADRNARIKVLKSQNAGMSRKELANLANSDPQIKALQLDRKITEGTVHDALRKPKKGKGHIRPQYPTEK